MALGDENRKVKFSFLGKDSVPFQRTITVIEPVYLNLKLYQKGKKNGAQLFDAIDTGTLNRYINRIVPEMTAKVFRMCNACISFESALSRTCLLYTSPSPRDVEESRMPSSA